MKLKAIKDILSSPLVIYAIVGVLLYLYLNERSQRKSEYDRYTNFLETNVQEDPNELQAKYLTSEEFSVYMGSYMDTLEKKFDTKAKNITNYYKIENTYGDTFVVQLGDTTIYNMSGKYFDHSDNCFAITGFINDSGQLKSTWSLADSLEVLGTRERKRMPILWGLFNPRWGKWRYYVKVKGQCDNATYFMKDAIDIIKKKK